MADKTNWSEAIDPLLKKYKNRKHPIEFQNAFQLLTVVVLSAQSSDKQINAIAPDLFKAVPDLKTLAKLKAEDLYPYISKVRGFRKKAEWLISIAHQIKTDKSIPTEMTELIKLPGIGRKSANVIRRGMELPPEGVIVDLHVVRVAPRLGITKHEDPVKIEKDIMEIIPQKKWEVGMSMSFLGRDVCHNTNPEHDKCVMKDVCEYYLKSMKKK